MTSRVLIVSPEAPGENMSGPAMRYWNLAEALAASLPVTLAAPGTPALTSTKFEVRGYQAITGAELPQYAAQADVLLSSGFVLHHFPFLGAISQPVVIDLYDPFVFENLQVHAAKPLPEQLAQHRISLAALQSSLRRGDFFVCASDTQRDFWLGMLAATGRINPQTMANDAALRELIDLVPFGVPDVPPSPRQAFIKGVYQGIAADDLVVYWGGGIWEWFDPLTAIRAMAEVAARQPRAKLFFAGVRHPNPDVPRMRIVETAQQLSAQLGLTGKVVFFNDWVPYAARADCLLEADVGLSLHFDNIETHFAYRTRLLDYIWAGLPMVVTRGDVLGTLAEKHGLAATVAPGDVAGTSAALLYWLEQAGQRGEIRQRSQALADELRWSRVVQPLLAFCQNPRRAADAGSQRAAPRLTASLLVKAWQSLRARGLRGLARDVRLYLGL